MSRAMFRFGKKLVNAYDVKDAWIEYSKDVCISTYGKKEIDCITLDDREQAYRLLDALAYLISETSKYK